MEYDCQTMPFNKLTVTESGIAQPLCNDCRAPDCSNPIREQTVSFMGRPVQMRLWTVGNVIRQVVACKGYIGDQNVLSSP